MSGFTGLRSIARLVSQVRTSGAFRAPSALTRNVGTSTAKSGAESTVGKAAQQPATGACTPKKNWVSYGFDVESEYADNHFLHVVSFLAISGCLVVGSYVFIYLPDHRYKDWALREAYIKLREREAAGLPPIDMNLIDPAKVKLPTDEELGDAIIII